MNKYVVTNKLSLLAALLALCVAVSVGLLSGRQAEAGMPTGAPAGPHSKVETRVLDDTANGKSTQFVALMARQADLSEAYSMRDQDARGWYVYNQLKAAADSSQAGLRAMLSARGISYRSFWVSNALVVSGDRSLVEAIA